MNAIGNIDFAWQALTDKYTIRVWKKVGPKISKDSQRKETVIVNLINTTGLDVDEPEV